MIRRGLFAQQRHLGDKPEQEHQRNRPEDQSGLAVRSFLFGCHQAKGKWRKNQGRRVQPTTWFAAAFSLGGVSKV